MTGEMEKLLGLGPIDRTRVLPGLNVSEDWAVIYVADHREEAFSDFFKKLVRHVVPPIPKQGGVGIEGCHVNLPTGEQFQAISFRGDIEGWREQIRLGAEAMRVSTGVIADEALVLEDGRSFKLSDCKVEFD